jgi:hypothetical protein
MNTKTTRIDNDCVSAIEDIISKFKEKDINISFPEASRILARDIYFNPMRERTPFMNIPEFKEHYRKNKTKQGVAMLCLV